MSTKNRWLLITLIAVLISPAPRWLANSITRTSVPAARPAPRHRPGVQTRPAPRDPRNGNHNMDATYTPTDFTATTTSVSTFGGGTRGIGPYPHQAVLTVKGGFGAGTTPHQGDTLLVKIRRIDYSSGVKVKRNSNHHTVDVEAMRVAFDSNDLSKGWSATTTFTAGTLPAAVAEEDVLVTATDRSDSNDTRLMSIVMHVVNSNMPGADGRENLPQRR